MEVSLQGETRQNREYRRQYVDQGYSKPSAWKQILRKARAEAKQIRIACCEGLCWPRQNSDYNSFNYEKNFDEGREHWQQHTTVRVSRRPSTPFAEPQRVWNNGSDMSEFSLQVDPVWQRKPRSPSKLRVKKVTFADV
ncbi:hypothetical protein O6H91_13G011100 [Diphasiastrum complanatum]|nr:hypothetical protein O6H91_13G011100 [Diphasiastrum complanatum]